MRGAADGELLGMCYREHPGSRLITRIRLRVEHACGKTVYNCEMETPEQAGELFRDMLRDTPFGEARGHVLTPSLNRGRYAAYCRMLHCAPLDA
jgi:hypothetical protein